MSILLEALKQKNQRVKDVPVSRATPEVPTLSLVEAEQSRYTESITSKEQAEASMQSLVSMLSIEPPEGLDWQLKSDVSAGSMGIKNAQVQESVASAYATDPTEPLALDLVLPQDTKSPVEVDETHQAPPAVVDLELKTNEVPSLAIESISTNEALLPTEAPILFDTQTPAVADDTPLIIDKQPAEVAMELAKPAIQAQTTDKLAVEAEALDNQSVSSKIQMPFVDKSPLSAQRFLSFSHRKQPESESHLSTDLASDQPKKHQPPTNRSRKPILLLGGTVIGLGLVAYVTLVAWESQQAIFMQEMAQYKNQSLALSELPDNAKLAESTKVESREADASLAAMVDEANNSVQKSLNPLAKPAIIKGADSVEKIEQPLPVIAKDKSEPSSRISGVLDTNQLSYEQRTAKHTKSSQNDLAQLNLQQTQPTAELLVTAFQAWQLGQIEQAERLYRQILEKQPQQRDALLGMLAVSQVNGSDPGIALGYSLELRRLYPKDREVRLATARVLGDVSNEQASETELKLALSTSENTAEASYRLGLLYAEQQRWAEAQSAFFEAVRKKPHQIDYRLNLAISYDQLGKYRLALEHYQVVLSQARAGLTKMDLRMIHERVSYLQSQRLIEE